MSRRAVRRLLATWGNGDYGRLGHGRDSASWELPCIVDSLADLPVTAVTCGSAHTVALTEDGSAHTTGLNDAGQLGHSAGELSNSDFRELLLPEATIGIAAGHRHTLLLTESGNVWSVGANDHGQLGLGKGSDSSSPWPRRINALAGAGITHIAAGAEHSLAVTGAGELLTWGAGAEGQLAHGSFAVPTNRDEPSPRLVASLRGTQVVSAAAGFLHSGCVSADGRIWMWGSNRFCQLGVQGAESMSDPVQVGLTGVEQLALGGHHTIALRHTGEAFSWGANENGVLGLGSKSWTSMQKPTLIPKSSFEQVAAGWKHCAALTSRGRLYCWGWGGSQGSSTAFAPMKSAGGQLGLGNDFDFPSPILVEKVAEGREVLDSSAQQWKAIQVSCGLNHTAAVIEVPA